MIFGLITTYYLHTYFPSFKEQGHTHGVLRYAYKRNSFRG